MGGSKTRCVLLAAVMITAGMGIDAPAASAAVFAAPIHRPPVETGTGPGHERTNAVCLMVGTGAGTPGLSLASHSGSAEDTGTITCSGTFYGHRVTGPGTFEHHGTITGTCLISHASERFRIAIPTDSGSMRFAGPYEQNSVGAVTEFVVYLPGARLTGISLAQPLPGENLVPGTCVTPVRNALAERIAFANDQRD